jgi:hypothetical protein
MAVIQPNVRGSTGLRQDLPGAGQRLQARGLGARHRRAARLDRPSPSSTRRARGGGGRQLRRLHEPGGGHALRDRIAGAIDDVGISHFVTFLNNTESYRRDLRRVEYGDERDPAMRAFLDRISPLTNAHRIRKPLFVMQGKNDPRVPYTEAEQIVAKVREQRHAGVVPARRERRPRLRQEGEQRLHAVGHAAVHAADHAEVRGWRPQDGRCRSSGVGLSVLP